MDTATYEPDVLASCHEPLLSQLYFFPLGVREGEGFAGSSAHQARCLRCPPVKLLK